MNAEINPNTLEQVMSALKTAVNAKVAMENLESIDALVEKMREAEKKLFRLRFEEEVKNAEIEIETGIFYSDKLRITIKCLGCRICFGSDGGDSLESATFKYADAFGYRYLTQGRQTWEKRKLYATANSVCDRYVFDRGKALIWAIIDRVLAEDVHFYWSKNLKSVSYTI